MLKDFGTLRFPELVIGIAGPIGIQIDEIGDALKAALHRVGYGSALIKITQEIANVSSLIKPPTQTDNFYVQMSYKMNHASAICRANDDPAYLMRYAIDAIRRERRLSNAELLPPSLHNLSASSEDGEDSGETGASLPGEDCVRQQLAYIIRQIKRPEEVELLRHVYGKQFILVSAYGAEADRREYLKEKIRRTLPVTTGSAEISGLVEDLIARDTSEEKDQHGQHLREAFHLADVFVDGISRAAMEASIARFVNALFGANDIAPSKVEYGMFSASSAALRSSDLSRQVGAAIMSPGGEVISVGCNEVPKAFGGTYWDTEEPDFRDIKIGSDPNDILKRDVVRDLIERLKGAGMLSKKALNLASGDRDMVDGLMKSSECSQTDGSGCLEGAMALDLTEYGRVVHAEMNAICESARLGHSVAGSILFCTTFPCHNCTKHILAAGISKVFFMEPYPKSRAKQLHFNEIELDKPSATRVAFLPFIGIAPNRYRDVFTKGKRKKNGIAQRWYYDEPSPMIDILTPKYIEYEKYAIAMLIGDVS